jgi:hypothetical protein
MTDTRKLIQRLTEELDIAASNLYFDEYAPDIKSALADAQTYLAQPEPPSLKEQALAVLDDAELDSAHYNILLRALEQLPDPS